MRKIWILLLCILLLCTPVLGAQTQISQFDAQVTVDEQGTCHVTLQAELFFAQGEREVRIPLASNARNIEMPGYAYSVRRQNGVAFLELYREAGFEGRETFTCSYEVPFTVSDTSEGQTFLLHLPESGWAYPMEHYNLHVTFPAEIVHRPRWSSGYYSEIFDNYLDFSAQGQELTAESNTPMRDSETVTLEMEFPPDTFDLRNQPGKTLVGDRIAFYVLLVLALAYWFFRLRYALVRPEARKTTDLETSPGEIPSQLFGSAPDTVLLLAHWASLGYLTIRRTATGRVILTRQMDMGNERRAGERRLFGALFRRGELCDARDILLLEQERKQMEKAVRSGWRHRIYRKSSGNPMLLRLLGVLAGFCTGLMSFDKLLPPVDARWLLLPLFALLCAVLSALIQWGCGAFFRRKGLVSFLTGLTALIGAMALGVVSGTGGTVFLSILLQCFCGLTTVFGGRRSAAGMERLNHLLGLRKFLRKPDKTLLQEQLRGDSQYFYRMLPYAEALGVAGAFASAFGQWHLEPCGWLTDSGRPQEGAAAFYASYRELFAIIRKGRRGSRPKVPGRPGGLPAGK